MIKPRTPQPGQGSDVNALWELLTLCADYYWQEDSRGRCREVLQTRASGDEFPLPRLLEGRTLRQSGMEPASGNKKRDRIYRDLRRQRKPFSNTVFALKSDGQTRYFTVHGAPRFDDRGRFLGYHCAASDVTRQKENDASLQRFRAAMDTSMDMVYLVDPQTLKFIDANRTACENMAMTHEELMKRGPGDVMGIQPRELRRRYRELISSGGSSRIEQLATNRRGESVYIEIFSRAARIDGRWIIIGISRNIHARKMAELETRRLQQMFSALSKTNESILRAESVNSLFQNACEAAIKSGRFNIAAVLQPGEDGYFRSVALAGEITPVSQNVEISYDADHPKGKGVAGTAWRNNRPAVINDFLNDPATKAWHEVARERNVASAAAFPLIQRREPIAILIFYADTPDVFDESTVRLLQNMADNLSYALDSFASDAERKRAEQQTRESEARFRSLTNLSSDFFWELDRELRFTQYEGHVVGEANTRAVSELIGRHLWDMSGITPESMSWHQFRKLLGREQRFRDFEFSFVNDEGETFHFSFSGEPIFDDEGRFAGYRGLSRDVTGKKRIANRIKFLATHDRLTGLPNRTMFGELLTQATRSASRYPDQAFAVLFIDLDRFKSVNDSYGHETGDSLLIEVGNRLRECVRDSDVVARMGGDEFVILLQRANEQRRTVQVARHIIDTFRNPIRLDNRDCDISASVGISIYGIDASDEETLMKHADAAMYEAKAAGRNNFQLYQEDIHRRIQERVSLELHLRGALERGELSLHYQPKLHLASGRITGVEALLRWNSPELGNVTPDRFIPIAEENGLIVPIGEWVMQTACRQLVDWRQHGLEELDLAVNLSARQFNDPRLTQRIQHALGESGLPAPCLELEITESMVMQNPPRVMDLMAEIKRLGVRFALDDFGTGYSSLGQLKNYPIDTLKIDRAFVREIPHDIQDMALMRAIIWMGSTLGLTTVAEGVETAAQLEFLRGETCDQVQGYYCYRPVTAEAFPELYARHEPGHYQTGSGTRM